tara:strand:- start:97 stop:387 length:291 start_codon:yes stop_codon:yes gene_type:complete
MSTLHTLNKSPDSNLLKSCLAVMREGDAILFIEDGIYHCGSAEHIRWVHESNKVYGLREDIVARATLSKMHDKVEAIDTARFVELCCEHDKVVSWF